MENTLMQFMGVKFIRQFLFHLRTAFKVLFFQNGFHQHLSTSRFPRQFANPSHDVNWSTDVSSTW